MRLCDRLGSFGPDHRDRHTSAPLSPSDQQILNVQQAERQIQANEQAVALEKARAAEKAARQRAAAQARQAKARAEAKAAQQAKLQALKRKPLLRNRNSKTIRIR